ncbi:MAG: hypothetical protein INR71_03590, partial [Terriglobus roseus]|nr:hypothetical protein [Terriglobus roseus]
MPGDDDDYDGRGAPAFPRYRDDEDADSSEGDTVTADETGPFLRPGDDELAGSDAGDYDDDVGRFKHHRILRHVPPRALRAARAVARWTKGPSPPRIYRIDPFLPAVQEAPLRLLDRYAPKRR